MVIGASGQPSDYYIFQVAAAQVVANFGSFAVHHTTDPLPAEVDKGKGLMVVMDEKKKDKKALKSLKTHYLPPDAIPTEDGVEATIMYLPVCIPLFKGHSIQEGSLNDEAVVGSMSNIHPLATLWFYSC